MTGSRFCSSAGKRPDRPSRVVFVSLSKADGVLLDLDAEETGFWTVVLIFGAIGAALAGGAG